MTIKIDVSYSANQFNIRCDDKGWAKRWLPLVTDLPLRTCLSSNSNECDALNLLFTEIDPLTFDFSNLVLSSQKEDGSFSIKLENPKPYLSLKIERCFQKVFPLETCRSIASFIPYEQLLQKLSTASSSQELVEELRKAGKSNLEDEIVHKYGKAAHEFLRRLPVEELARLLKELESMETTSEEIISFKRGLWNNPCMSDPLKAIKAFLEGKIDVMRLSTLLLYCECTKVTDEPMTFQLVDEFGNIDETAASLLLKGVASYLNHEEFARFIDSIKKLPIEDTQFFKIPYSIDPDRERCLMRMGQLFSNVNIVEYFYHLNHFRMHLILTGDKHEMIVFPPTLQGLLLEAKFNDQAMKPNPVLGLSKGVDFEHIDQRDVLIPLSVCITNPAEADGYKADGIGFYYHDAIYHMFNESSNPHRAAWIELAQAFKSQKKIKIWMFMVDRDFGIYTSVSMPIPHIDMNDDQLKGFMWLKERDQNELFWVTLAFLKIMRVDGRLGMQNETCFWPIALNHIAQNQHHWNQNYGINFNGLDSIHQNIQENAFLANTLYRRSICEPVKELYQTWSNKGKE